MDSKKLYDIWVQNATEDIDLVDELASIKGDDDAITDRFYKELEFVTGGLRGEIGAGTNRMNIYNVRRATQGLADYVLKVSNSPSVAIAYDSRIKSDVFAKAAAEVLAANGIKVYIYPELMPTPMLSFAVRHLKCDAGIVVTASHNPAKYNGYKVYGNDGCQIGLEVADAMIEVINSLDVFGDIKTVNFDEAIASGNIEYIKEDTIEAYLDAVQSRSVNAISSDLKVIYTPLHGSGNKPVRAILKRIGLENVVIVPEQELPDGNFPTAPYPNPEIRQAFECALKLAEKENPDLLLATDPDSDRCGIAVRHNGEYILTTGNEVGCLMLDYILKARKEKGTLPNNPVAVKTIVTSDLAAKIAENYGCELREVLTGFKFIGEQIYLLEEKNEEERFVLGFEESYGYLAGTYVRDKDAVIASMLICEMASYYKSQGKTLIDVLNELYEKYGLYLHSQICFTCEGVTGMQRMKDIMDDLQNNPPSSIGGLKVVAVRDYIKGIKIYDDKTTEKLTLPKTKALFYELENHMNAVVRPSGTEPKIKVYITAIAEDRAKADEITANIGNDMKKIMGFAD